MQISGESVLIIVVVGIINATLGALILLLVIGFFRRGVGGLGNWRRG